MYKHTNRTRIATILSATTLALGLTAAPALAQSAQANDTTAVGVGVQASDDALATNTTIGSEEDLFTNFGLVIGDDGVALTTDAAARTDNDAGANSGDEFLGIGDGNDRDDSLLGLGLVDVDDNRNDDDFRNDDVLADLGEIFNFDNDADADVDADVDADADVEQDDGLFGLGFLGL